MKMLQSGWFCAVVGTVLYLGTMAAVWKTPVVTPPPVAAVKERAAEPKPSWEFYSPEVEQLVEDLRAQKTALATRERELKDWEARLAAEQAELKSVLAGIERKRAEFDALVVRVRDEEVANLRRLARIYSAMAPENAVAVLKEMKDDEVVKILAFMKDAQTAPILETLAQQGPAEARRAAQITERIRVSVSAAFGDKTS
jgi:flagellar motility protein MotE (MotC chaperone)